MCFALDSHAAEQRHIVRERCDEMVQKARLATSGFTLHHDNGALSGACPEYELIELLQLGLSSQQHE